MSQLFEVKKGKKVSVKDFILDKFSTRTETMTDRYRSWMLNLAWVRGFQNVDYDSEKSKFRTSDSKHPWKARLVSNLMLPIVRRNVSQLVQKTNQWDVIPATADQEDISVAETSKKLCLAYWDLLDMPQKLMRIAFWQSICSSAFLKVGWDADLGDEFTAQAQDLENETLTQFMEMMGITQAPDTVTVKEGDAFVDVVTPFSMLFDDSASVMEDSDWSLESQLKTKDWVVNSFGNKFKNIPEGGEQELFIYPFIHGERTGKVPTNGVIVHEFNVRRTKKHPNGLHAIMTGSGEMLKTPDDSPYEHGLLPYAHFLEIYDPASLWGTCTIEQIRPHQARYNRVQSAVLENINLNSNVQWLNPRQSGIKQFTNRPGQAYKYNAPYKPEQMQLKPMPAYIDQFLNRTRLDMQDTASNHDVSEGKAEPGTRSGRAVLALQDADDSIKGPVMLWFDSAVAKTGRLLLHTLAQYIQEERVIQVSGTFTELEAVKFKGSELTGKSQRSDYFKVRTKTYGRQPLSRAAREGMVRTLLEVGLMNPQTHREELLDILGASDVISLYDAHANDRLRQYEEVKILVKGEEVGVYFGQNHEVHIKALKKYIASNEWDKLEPQFKEVISQHLRHHLEQQTVELIYQQAFASGLMGGNNAGRTSGNGQQQRQSSSGGGTQTNRSGTQRTAESGRNTA